MFGKPSRVVMKWDTPDEIMEIAKILYPETEVVREERKDDSTTNKND